MVETCHSTLEDKKLGKKLRPRVADNIAKSVSYENGRGCSTSGDEHTVHVDEPFIYECDPQAMGELCEQSEDKPLNSAFAQSDITHGNFSDTTEHVHLSHFDIGSEPILQHDKYASEPLNVHIFLILTSV